MKMTSTAGAASLPRGEPAAPGGWPKGSRGLGR